MNANMRDKINDITITNKFLDVVVKMTTISYERTEDLMTIGKDIRIDIIDNTTRERRHRYKYLYKSLKRLKRMTNGMPRTDVIDMFISFYQANEKYLSIQIDTIPDDITEMVRVMKYYKI